MVPLNAYKVHLSQKQVASYISSRALKLVWAKCMRTNFVCALADIVATKLGIIFIFILLSSFHFLFSQKGFAYDFEFLHAFLSNKKKKI